MDEMNNQEPCIATKLRLKSNGLIDVVNLLAWARRTYRCEMQLRGPVAPIIAPFSDGYGLGPVLAERLLRAEIQAVADGDEVVIWLCDSDARDYKTRRATLSDVPRGLVEVTSVIEPVRRRDDVKAL
jgi:hypothetical protein